MTCAPPASATQVSSLPVPAATAKRIQQRLLEWWERNRRDLPWRNTKDPYRVLVAEILLQQTHFGKVLPAYDALLAVAPTPHALAATSVPVLEDIVRPLGLVRRAATMAALGRALVEDHGGRVPEDEAALLSLPGVGRYAANAVRCFAFGHPEPLADKLTARVYRRLLELSSSARPGRDERLWAAVAELQPASPRDFHLAVIDFASLVCRAQRPSCPICPLRGDCSYATRTDSDSLPALPPTADPYYEVEERSALL